MIVFEKDNGTSLPMAKLVGQPKTSLPHYILMSRPSGPKNGLMLLLLLLLLLLLEPKNSSDQSLFADKA